MVHHIHIPPSTSASSWLSDSVPSKYFHGFFLHVTNSQIPQIVQDVSLLECLESLVEKDLGIKTERMTQLLSVAMSLEGEKESDFPSRQMGNLFEIYNCSWFN